MDARALHRRIPTLIPALSVAALLVLCCSSTSIASVATVPKSKSRIHLHTRLLAGKWSGQYSGAFSGTFTLHWTQTGSRLKGSITLSNPPGTYGINGSVKGKVIKFGAVAAGATYAGSVSGKSMAGHYNTPRGGGQWSAHKTA
jgi:hypothetical protein